MAAVIWARRLRGVVEASARAHWLDERERTCETDKEEARYGGQLVGATLGRATMGWSSHSW
jgi:hypothetical protein